MLFFQAFTGCDILSAFRGKGKKTAWQAWEVYPQVTPVFKKLSQYPPVVENADYNVLEKFVITMYDKNSTMDKVDEVRLDLLARKQRPYDGIPPTNEGLSTKQAAYEARQQCAKCKLKALLTGGGRKLVRCGKSFGRPFHPLPRVVSN
ncbi:hypothetical protein Pcinc_015186 [Petrolisthes cinctipes]|uniref:Uncharacterized protein n=1 Tax=Petrolisthes cinctipes TaxID=88211 RepID=A0AAE1FWA0_PETCI|nr:hypothetical protein Pcinc_015186 [Petrolisthes cinctipes]